MDAWLEVALEEYKTLREEILRSIDTQQTILRLGTAAAGIVPAVSVNFVDEEIPQGVLFLLFAPLVSYLILIVWMGEVLRLIRAGAFLRGLETRINAALERPALGWEYWAHQLQEHGRAPVIRSVEGFHMLGIVSMFSLIALGSMAAGIAVLHGTSLAGWWLAALVAAAAVGTIVCAAVLATAYLETQDLRRRFYSPGQPTTAIASAEAVGTRSR